MYVPRASILARPVREGAKANQEHAELEHMAAQNKLQAKADRLAATEERLFAAHYATNEEKRQAW
jgi:hypothetical protein